jgi:hypothetical protein
MANTYTLIEAQELTTTTADLTFSSIPADYTDLKLTASVRALRTGFPADDLVIQFNGSTSSYSGKRLYGLASSVSSDTQSDIRGFASDVDQTASVFGSNDFYIPNYLSSNYKSVSMIWLQKTTEPMLLLVYMQGYGQTPQPLTALKYSVITAIWFNTQLFIYTASRTHKEKTMANPTRIEVNCTTGEVLEIELTDAEVADMAVAAQAAADQQAAAEAEAAAVAAAKAAGQAKLAALGLTAEEIAALTK